MSDVVVITGTSSGIGRQTAETLVTKGFTVFGTVRNEEDARSIRAAGIVPLLMDVTDHNSVTAASLLVESSLENGRLVGLVNNAGIAAAGPIELLRLETLREVLEVNVLGTVAVLQAFLPLLKRCSGRIVNMSSVSGRVAMPFIGAYASSKFALEALSDSLRRELRGSGVTVVVVEPGSIRTPIWEKASNLTIRPTRGTSYENIEHRIREYAKAQLTKGLPAQRVADAVYRALTIKRPPTRMLVVSSRVETWLSRLLPAKTLDRVIARRLR